MYCELHETVQLLFNKSRRFILLMFSTVSFAFVTLFQNIMYFHSSISLLVPSQCNAIVVE